jgi:hypothetical protein
VLFSGVNTVVPPVIGVTMLRVVVGMNGVKVGREGAIEWEDRDTSMGSSCCSS